MPQLRRGRTRSGKEKVIDYTNSQMSALIDEHIHNERDRAILKRRLIDGICFEPLAEEFELSTQRVKVIVYRAQDKLFRHLK